MSSVELSLPELGASTTASAAKRVIPSIWRLAAKRVHPIVCLNDGTSRVPLVCIHPITGDVVGLGALAALLGAQSFYGIQVPRERMTAAFAASIEGMAAHYVDLLIEQFPSGAIHLAGWSAGAIVALEMARQLRERGRDVPLLIALDGAPCNTGGGLQTWHPLYAFALVRNLPRWLRDNRKDGWSLGEIAERIKTRLAICFGLGTSGFSSKETLDAETMQRLLDTDGWLPGQKGFMHEMHKAMLAYVPRRYDGRVIVYEMQTQPLDHLRQIGAAWKALASDLEIVTLPGNHVGMVSQPTVGTIAAHLLSRL